VAALTTAVVCCAAGGEEADDGALLVVGSIVVTALAVLDAAPRMGYQLLDYGTYTRRTLLNTSDAELRHFTFFRRVVDFRRLKNALGFPDAVRTKSRFNFDGGEALLLFVARLRSPATLDDLAINFGRRPSHVSELIHGVYRWLFNRFYAPILNNVNRWRNHLAVWAAAINRRAPAAAPCPDRLRAGAGVP
jgi:hypothetical protein